VGLEDADFIDELDPANPAGGDGVGAGDNHLRMIKKVLQQALPGNTSAGVVDVDWNIGQGNLGNDYLGRDSYGRDLDYSRNGSLGGWIDIKHVDVNTPGIRSANQVAIAAGSFDMFNEDSMGASYGIAAVDYVGTGQIELLLDETNWIMDNNLPNADLIVTATANMGLVGAGIVFATEATSNPTSGWFAINVERHDPSSLFDAWLSVGIINTRRQIP